jgi:WD40 repeat protein
LLASGSADTTVNLWRVSDGARWHTIRDHGGAVNAVALTPDTKLLATGGGDRSIRLWRLPDARFMGSASDPTLPVRPVVSFSCD